MTPSPAGPDTTMFIAAREALLALIALAGDRADQATDPDQTQLWALRRDDWTRQWRELQPDDLDTQRRILTDHASLLRDQNQPR